MKHESKIDIPFGAKDSELKGWEYTIPEGMEAIIKDGKVIVREKEGKDEKIRKALINLVSNDKAAGYTDFYMVNGITCDDAISYLERQKDESQRQYALGVQAGREEVLYGEEKEQNGEDEECTDFTIYYPLKNGKGEYECIPYSFYGSLTSFSEDKDLIDFLRNCFYTEEECNEWIGRQKEQNPVEYVKKFKALCDAYEIKLPNREYDIYGLCEDLHKLSGDIHKSAECIEFDNEFENQVSHLLASALNGEHEYNEGFVKYAAQSLLEYAKKEQKSIDCVADSVKFDEGFKTGREVGFREGVESVKPVEWSEKDETALGDLMWCIEQARKSAKDENDMGNVWFAENWLKNRLKSLHPQPSWKPSEEQMGGS